MSFTYKGLEAQHKRHLVNGEEVAKQLERLRQQSVKTVAITDRPAQEGDELVLDYAGFIGDEQFQGGTAEKQNLTLGSGMFIPGFEEQLLGTVPGQDKTIHLSFPEDYHIPDLAGREARFDCHVHEIRLNTTYELNDEFAWSMGLENLKHLEEELANSMQAYADEMGELDLGDNLIRQAAQTLEIELDEETVERAKRIMEVAPQCKIEVVREATADWLKEKLAAADILANATPCGMHPNEDTCALEDLSLLHSGLIVTDAVYNPQATKLILAAEAAGCKTMRGKTMLLWQGVEAFRLYTGKDMPVDQVREKFFT